MLYPLNYFYVSGDAFTYPPAAQTWQKPARAGNRGKEPSAPLLLHAFPSGNKWAVCQWCAHLEEGQEPPKPRPCIPSCPSSSRDTFCLVKPATSRNKNHTVLNFFLRVTRTNFSFWKRNECTNTWNYLYYGFSYFKSETKLTSYPRLTSNLSN